MTFNGNFATITQIDGSKMLFSIDENDELVTIAKFTKAPLGLACLGTLISTIARDGGSVFDCDKQEYVAGSLDQLVP